MSPNLLCRAALAALDKGEQVLEPYFTGRQRRFRAASDDRKTFAVRLHVVSLWFGIASLLWQFFSANAWSAERQVLQGHVPAAVQRLAPIGRLDPSKRLKLAIGLPLRNQEALTEFLRELSDPASPNYRKYLTPAQFTERFAPLEKDYQAVIQFAKSHKLIVTGTHRNRIVLDVESPIGDIENALHVTLRSYAHPTEAREFYAPDREPSLDLETRILGIEGLDNYSLPHPQRRQKAAGLAPYPNSATGSGPGGGYGGGDFRAAYVPGTQLTGAGQSVALFEYDGYYGSDITAYRNQFGLPKVSLVKVSVDGGVSPPGSGDFEVSLDIEMTIAMAPGLSAIYIYEEPESDPPSDALSEMANPPSGIPLSYQLSCSWNTGGNKANLEAIFQEMSAQGQSFFNATGDNDAFVGSIANPSDSPSITQVGATTLTTSSPGGSYVSETVWNWGDDNGQYIGSGGGVSTYFGIPSWQNPVNMVAAHGSGTMRNVPDVSVVGDQIYTTYNNGQSSDDCGGTSYAAPLWAAFTALVNQQRATNGLPPVGFLNPVLYAIGTSANYTTLFHDITTGNNFRPARMGRFLRAGLAGQAEICAGVARFVDRCRRNRSPHGVRTDHDKAVTVDALATHGYVAIRRSLERTAVAANSSSIRRMFFLCDRVNFPRWIT